MSTPEAVAGGVTAPPHPTGPSTGATAPVAFRDPTGPHALTPAPPPSPFLAAAVTILRAAPRTSVAMDGAGWYFSCGGRRSEPCHATAFDALLAAYQDVISRVYGIVRGAQFEAGEATMLPFTLDWGPGYTAEDV